MKLKAALAVLVLAICYRFRGRFLADETYTCGKNIERAMRERSMGWEPNRWGDDCEVLDAAEMDIQKLTKEFNLQAVRPNRPIVIKNYAFKHLGNMSKWQNVTYLEEKFGETMHRVQFGRESRRMIFAVAGDATLEHPYERRGVPFSESLDMIKNSQGNVFLTQIPMYSPSAINQAQEEEDEKLEEERSEEESDGVPRTRSPPPRHNVSQLEAATSDPESGGYSEMGIPLMWQDLAPIQMTEDTMELHSVNFWMSKILEGPPRESTFHFDPSDNFLVMVAGTKEAVMVSSLDSHWVHPKRLYATRYSSPPGQNTFGGMPDTPLREDPLSEDSRDNFSPVDYMTPDTKRFPFYEEAKPTKCKLNPGDMLWMPAFTWHNILSHGDPQNHNLNVAVNYWYEPNTALADYHEMIHQMILDANDYI